MKIVSIVGNNRVGYLREMLASLKENDLRGWEMVAYLEPPGVESADLIKKEFPGAGVVVNSYRMGLPLNAFQAWHTPFKKGADLVFYVEEDAVLAKDAVRLVDWYGEVERGLPQCLGLTLYNDSSKEGREGEVARVRRFRAFAMATTATRWVADWQKSFFADPRGWDFGINGMLGSSKGGFMLAPVAARANHIGRLGQHCRSDYHDKWFSWVRLSQVRVEKFLMREGAVEIRDYLQPDEKNPFHDGVCG